MSISSASVPRTLSELFAWRVTVTPTATAYRYFDGESNAWVGVDWAGISKRVARWKHAMGRLALPRGARVAVLLPNGLDAVCIDQATLALACTPVPLHAVDNAANIAYILNDSGASVLIASTREQWTAIASTGPLTTLRTVILAHGEGDFSVRPDVIAVLSLSKWLSLGEASQESEPPGQDDLAALVYTSGTTGKPKGVMLSHRSIVSNVFAALARAPVGSDDVFLSFLPLSHMFERTVGYYL